jgi:2-methylisocitrate lyase-like PEP mutase family enzyme
MTFFTIFFLNHTKNKLSREISTLNILPGLKGAKMEKKSTTASEKRKKMRGMIQSGEPVMAPGIYDAFCARMVEQAGFPAAYLTGNGVSACLLGQPDVGLITLTEVAQHAGRIARALDIPLIADADTGYGNALNVMRTVKEFEAAGVAAIHIEDQVSPKKCGHLPGSRLVVSEREQVLKLQAALEAAIRRARAYHAAGADMIFVELTGPNRLEELRVVSQSLKAPLVVNLDSAGPFSMLTLDDLQKMGIALAIYPGIARYVVLKAVSQALKQMKEQGSIRSLGPEMASFDEYNEVLGWSGVQALEKRFLIDAPPAG